MDTFALRRIKLKQLVDTLAKGNVRVFAARFGYAPAQISQYLSSTYNEGRSMGERAARALEKRVNVPQGWLDQPIEPIPSDHPRAAYAAADHVASENVGLAFRRIPVLFTAHLNENGLVHLEPTSEDGPERFVEFVSRDTNTYAVQIKGQMLKPRIRNNEFLIIEPSLEPAPGDDVLVKYINDESVVMQFLYKRGSEWTFGPLNETGPNVSCDESEIVSAATITAVVRAPR
ncbi:S24 family peptidase [Caballeronia sp. AZ10_KS36]|uniref:S24 family peptidase n=1 Tax=Caballeronia sp. AZ10_KS36 TaxID=2921757 RepID=UPI002027EBD8|nr:S24 family peptidase [Caballeronia sp. AZ10_KS36]